MSLPHSSQAAVDLLAPLRQYWGYGSFRPLQERIIRSLLAGRDACVVMPTGVGKSLCYQLPAALQPVRTAVVLSPLIALMQDQVAQLETMGIPAAALNSTVGAADQAAIWRQAQSGRFRLLYLSPERLARPDTVAALGRIPLSMFVIDEAHCISEWGHEFRPEYRQLSVLRQHFPSPPIAAFTASATRRVRHDILAQLQLRDPDKVIASFHRPNLRYWVHACKNAADSERHLLAALAVRGEGHVIVYAPTIAQVEATAAKLSARGLSALPYHGKMDAAARRLNQERWMGDEVNILVGTLAFGLGINKASVRAVIHLALPKSIEQYYQEAGRAGRDGAPADCVLLWQRRDLGLLAHFNEQIEDPAEREHAWQRYHQVRAFAESPACRHRQICIHFGERPSFDRCDACDVCGYQPDWLAAAAAAPAAAAVRARRPITTTTAPAAPQEGDLRTQLREWRRLTAAAGHLPAYIVMHDRTLDELARLRPRSPEQLLDVPGIGARKAETYGPALLEIFSRFD